VSLEDARCKYNDEELNGIEQHERVAGSRSRRNMEENKD